MQSEENGKVPWLVARHVDDVYGLRVQGHVMELVDRGRVESWKSV